MVVEYTCGAGWCMRSEMVGKGHPNPALYKWAQASGVFFPGCWIYYVNTAGSGGLFQRLIWVIFSTPNPWREDGIHFDPKDPTKKGFQMSSLVVTRVEHPRTRKWLVPRIYKPWSSAIWYGTYYHHGYRPLTSRMDDPPSKHGKISGGHKLSQASILGGLFPHQHPHTITPPPKNLRLEASTP